MGSSSGTWTMPLDCVVCYCFCGPNKPKKTFVHLLFCICKKGEKTRRGERDRGVRFFTLQSLTARKQVSLATELPAETLADPTGKLGLKCGVVLHSHWCLESRRSSSSHPISHPINFRVLVVSRSNTSVTQAHSGTGSFSLQLT